MWPGDEEAGEVFFQSTVTVFWRVYTEHVFYITAPTAFGSVRQRVTPLSNSLSLRRERTNICCGH
jgi:hypothetical protein